MAASGRPVRAGQVVEGGPEASLPPSVRRLLPAGERVVLAFKPHPAFVLLRSLRALLIGGGALGLLALVWSTGPTGAWAPVVAWGVLAVVLLVGARVAWCILEWVFRWYVLTGSDVVRVGGVLRRVASSVPRTAVRTTAYDAPLLERALGLGSVGFASAGTGGYEVIWATIARPAEAANAARAEGGPGVREVQAPGEGRGPVVIGLAGGIGSGKSTVARAFARLGCLISDSDLHTREALEREDVRAALRGWWGENVIGADGSVDRSAVARIVFADPAQRERLEGLIHPLVRRSRAELVAQAQAARAPAVVVDAPLLFEAGVDAECDAVVYVEAPEAVRRARVASRGWEAGEWERREKAQMPLERKRDRSDYVVVNAGASHEIDRQVEGVLRAILSQRSQRSGP